MMQISMILDTDAYIYDAANFVTNERTNGRTNKAILGVGFLLGSFVLPIQYNDMQYHPTPRIALFVRPSVRPLVTKNAAS